MTELIYSACIDPDHPALPGHFPGHPVVPGVVLLSHVEAAARQRYGAGVRIAELASVKFMQPLLPGVAFTITLQPAAGGAIRFTLCGADGSTIAGGSLRLACPEQPA